MVDGCSQLRSRVLRRLQRGIYGRRYACFCVRPACLEWPPLQQDRGPLRFLSMRMILCDRTQINVTDLSVVFTINVRPLTAFRARIKM